MTFGFGSLNKISRDSWPRVRLPTISGQDLAIQVGGFVRQDLLPIIETITDLQTYLAFLLADREPNPWLTSPNHMIRVAQVIAVAAQLGRSSTEIKECLGPYYRQIETRMRYIAADAVIGVEMYVDKLFSDWASRLS